MKNQYKKPSWFFYGFVRFLALIIGKFIFKIKIRRNELKKEKGPCVIIANHECALDFIYLMNATRSRITFVISKTFHDTLPFQGIINKLGFISKQQFQTNPGDLKRMKKVIESNGQLCIFPAGLMPENGLSTAIPPATYKFLKWMNADIYVARITGSYFVNRKWGKGFSKGRTYIDTYKLFTKENIKDLSEEEIKQKVDDALIFDAYSEQEKMLSKFSKGNNVIGLEKVLYECPSCYKENGVLTKNNDTLVCKECGFSHTMDKYGFFHVNGNFKEFRHVSKWDIDIYERLREKVKNNPNYEISSLTDLYMINTKSKKYEKVGQGSIRMNKDYYEYSGTLSNKDVVVKQSIHDFYVVPTAPKRNSIEFQDGEIIYRYVLKGEGSFVNKWNHLIKIFYEINNGVNTKIYPKED